MAQYNPALTDPLYPGGLPPSGTATTVPGTRNWSLGSYTTGSYPASVTFYSDRLAFGGATNTPDRVDLSVSSQYNVFSPNALLDGTVADSNALGFGLNSNTVNAIRWMSPTDHGLLLGTSGGPWMLKGATASQPLSPTNVDAKQAAPYGAQKVPAVVIGRQTLFLQTGGRHLRDAAYDFYVDGLSTKDISLLAEHLTTGGFTQMAVQQTPTQIVWLVRADGLLVSMCYDPEQKEVAWAQHPIGGNGVAQSVAVIPDPTGSRDELWLAVKRMINGAAALYVEKMSKIYEIGDAVSGNFVPGDTLFHDSGVHKTFGSPVTTVTGLTWLEGETVSVLADSATHPDVTVTSGGITLQRSATDVSVGLPYESRARTMRVEAGSADGTAQSKIKRIHKVAFRMYDTLGLFVRANSPYASDAPVSFRTTGDDMNAPPPLFTGDKIQLWEGDYEYDGTIEFGQSEPLPSNISAIVAHVDTQDD